MILSERAGCHQGVPKDQGQTCAAEPTSTSHGAFYGSTSCRPLQHISTAQQSEGAPHGSAFNVEQDKA